MMEEAESQRKVYTNGFSKGFLPEVKLGLSYVGGKLEISDSGMQNIYTTEGVFDVSDIDGVLNALLGRHIAVIPEHSGDIETIFMSSGIEVNVPLLAAANRDSKEMYEGKNIFWLWRGTKLTVRRGNEWGYLEDVTHAGRSIKLNSNATPSQIEEGMNTLTKALRAKGIYPNSLNPSDIARTEIQRHCKSATIDLTRGSMYVTDAKIVRTLVRALQVYKAGYKDAPIVGLTTGYSDDERNAFGAALYDQHSLHPNDTDWIESTNIDMLKTPSLVWAMMQADVTNLPTGTDIKSGLLRRRTKVEDNYSLTVPVMGTLPGQFLGLSEIRLVLSVGGRLENIKWATWFIAKRTSYPFRQLIEFIAKYQAELPILKMVLQRMAALMASGITIQHIPAHFWNSDSNVVPWRRALAEGLEWNEVMDVHSPIFMPLYTACVTERVASRTASRVHLVRGSIKGANTDGLEHESPSILKGEYGNNMGQLRHSEKGEIYILNDSNMDAPDHDTALLRVLNISYKDLAINTKPSKSYIDGPVVKHRRGLGGFSEGVPKAEAHACMAELITYVSRLPIGPQGRMPKKNVRVRDTLSGPIYYEPLRTDGDLYEHTKSKDRKYLPE